MIDFGFDKLALIGAVALMVIGPERLPKVARTVGHLIGKMQRYVADVKSEVNRSIELDELKKMKGQFEDAARNVEQTVSNEIHQTNSELRDSVEAGSGAAVPRIDPALFKASPSDQIKVGNTVLHLKFGEGKVLNIDGGKDNRIATIFFEAADDGQEKRIMLKFAKILLRIF